MKKILFVDLDDTLFQSYGKCPEDSFLTPVAYLTDGNPISFASPGQLLVLEMFQKEMMVIPVTARNMDAFSRVDIKFRHGAVLNYGGVILEPDGSPDQVWMDRSRTMSSGELDGLLHLQKQMQDESEKLMFDLRVRVIHDQGLPFYLVAKSAGGDVQAVAAMAGIFEDRLSVETPGRYRIHSNGNNLAVIPDWLDKRHATEYMIEKLGNLYGQLIIFGMGDSLIDLGFMNLCNYMIVPSKSQIAQKRLEQL